MPPHRIGAIVMMAGSVIFLVAAFSPLSRVFAERSAERKLEIITAAGAAWPVHQVLFFLGAAVLAVGLALTAHHLRQVVAAPHLYASAAMVFIGSLLWARHLYLRGTDPVQFVEGLVPVWLFAGYSLLTIVGLGLFGWALLATPLASWVGWMIIGSMSFFLVVGIAFGDLPPFVFYLVMLVAGAMIYRMGSIGGG